MKWHCEPKVWKVTEGQLELVVDKQTDFWRITHYDFIRDNGHFYFEEMKGDFEASVKVMGQYKDLFDQAGLMVRLDERNWIKTGIEFVNGVQNLSTVVTREFSDWSLVSKNHRLEAIWLKMMRKNDFVEIKYSLDGMNYEMMRLAYFPPNTGLKVGIMAAAPDGDGFWVKFDDFELKELI